MKKKKKTIDTVELRIRISPDQYVLIKTKAQLFGFKTISAYVRGIVLRVNLQTERRLKEIHQELLRRKV